MVSAALLFLLEPMVGKFVLPLLGSAPEVWPTTVLFFQAALLAGYAFAHLTSRLPARRQALLQLGLIVAAAAVLPIGVPDSTPPESENPIPWLVALLATTAGLPFFALAALGPMLQRWLAGTRHRAARDPYFLFAASNGGSLLGLLAYPLVLEPQLSLGGQGMAWSIGYVLALALVVASAAVLWLQQPRHAVSAAPAPAPARRGGGGDGDGETLQPPERDAPTADAEPERSDWRRRLLWLALAAVPSSLMLGTTSYLTRDVSPIPLLWVVPLALYLFTFVVAFSPWTNTERLAVLGRRLLPGAAILMTFTLVLGAQKPLAALLLLHLGGVAIVGLLCHGRLAAGRPGTDRLTEFYLWVALGGALGGAFNAVISPLIFPGLVEYPLAIVAACLLRPAPPKTRPDLLELLLRDPRATRAMDFVVPLLFGGAVAAGLVAGGESQAVESAVAGVACGLALNLSRRPVRFALTLGAMLLAASIAGAVDDDVLNRDRTFFGIYRVVASDDGVLHQLYSGTTLHGAERVGARPPEPLGYYGPSSPSGQAFAQLPAATTRRVAAVGLGTGSLACLQRPGTQLTFFEIDPAVVRIARDPRFFTFLRDCPVRPPVVTGDGRRSLEREPAGSFSLVAVDAFNSDAIPLHLITREAVGLYVSRVAQGGALLFHLTNRYLDLEPVVGNIAAELDLICRIRVHTPTGAQQDRGYQKSTWALLTRRPADLGTIRLDRRWTPCATDPSSQTWTDDYSNPLDVIKWG
ncbi:MAG: fused MFS/spermidine synthase, partial [Solirubrobacteraceae bacterium]